MQTDTDTNVYLPRTIIKALMLEPYWFADMSHEIPHEVDALTFPLYIMRWTRRPNGAAAAADQAVWPIRFRVACRVVVLFVSLSSS